MELEVRVSGSASFKVFEEDRLYNCQIWVDVLPQTGERVIEPQKLIPLGVSFHRDFTEWLEHHVDDKILTDQENVPRDTHFIMDTNCTIYDFPAYLYEIAITRARPFSCNIAKMTLEAREVGGEEEEWTVVLSED
jgi:hypothetical protein